MAANRTANDRKPGRPARALLLVASGGILLAAVFAGLGLWQVQRLSWKTDLIERVEARVAAEPVEAPGREQWSTLAASTHEYRRVRLEGRFLHGKETLVQAVTALGPGFWVMTPFERSNGEAVLVNRGFVPPERRDPASRAEVSPAGNTIVTGLLRISEPEGGFLRTNDPAGERWFSRDIAAIGKARGLSDAAPYFVDAGPGADPAGWPRGGLTVIAFRNHHLVYALTWFALSLMVAGATVFVLRDAWRRRPAPGAAARPQEAAR